MENVQNKGADTLKEVVTIALERCVDAAATMPIDELLTDLRAKGQATISIKISLRVSKQERVAGTIARVEAKTAISIPKAAWKVAIEPAQAQIALPIREVEK